MIGLMPEFVNHTLQILEFFVEYGRHFLEKAKRPQLTWQVGRRTAAPVNLGSDDMKALHQRAM